MDFTKFERKVYSNIIYYLYGKGGDSVTVKFTCVMNDEVDGEILQHAAEKASARYPYLSLKQELRADGLYFVHNPLPLKVIHTELPITLCSEETNYQLQAITYNKNRIEIQGHHALYDGVGATNFRETLLYYYCQEKYDAELKAPEGIRLLGDEISEEEYREPYDDMPAFDFPAGSKVTLKENFVPFNKLTPSGNNCYILQINEEDFLKFCKSSGTSVFAMSAILYAKAINKYRTDNSAVLKINSTLNVRKGLKASRTIFPAVGGFDIQFTDEMLAQPLGELGPAVRADIKNLASDECIAHNVAALSSMFKMFSGIPLPHLKAMFQDPANQLTAPMISYIGKLNWGDICKHVKYGYSAGSFPNDLVLEMNSLSGTLAFAFTQYFKEDIYVKAVCEELDKNGVRYELDMRENETVAMVAELF